VLHITSHRAEEELSILLDRLDQVSLTGEPDRRFMRFGPNKNFSVKSCYYALNFVGISCVGNQKIWSSFAPQKCKIFSWLALHNRLSAKERLAKRGIISEARCLFGCQSEGLTHLRFLCPHTSFLWRKYNVLNFQGLCSMQGLITNPRVVNPALRKDWASIFIAITWNIWLARNKKAFDNVLIPASTMETNS
jgi:hypothetical protein